MRRFLSSCRGDTKRRRKTRASPKPGAEPRSHDQRSNDARRARQRRSGPAPALTEIPQHRAILGRRQFARTRFRRREYRGTKPLQRWSVGAFPAPASHKSSLETRIRRIRSFCSRSGRSYCFRQNESEPNFCSRAPGREALPRPAARRPPSQQRHKTRTAETVR